jgi:hypothetical protein
MKTCTFPASTFSPNVTWGFQNLEVSAPGLSASVGLTPQEQTTAVGPGPQLNIINAGGDVMDGSLASPRFGDEFEAGIDEAE